MLETLSRNDAFRMRVAPPGALRSGPSWDARLRGFVTALETRVPGSAGHARRVADQSRRIGRGLGLSAAEIERIDWAARVHDCGKVIVSPEILEKPSCLTPCEYAEVQRHAAFGARLVASVGDPELTAIVRGHHERIDGSGYPDGLTGEEIPLGARIVAVADTFDALTAARPYREARSPMEAMAVIAGEAGRTLDLAVVAAFLGRDVTNHGGFVPIWRRNRSNLRKDVFKTARAVDDPRMSLLSRPPLRRLLAVALLLVALGGGIYLLAEGTTTPASAATARVARPPKGSGFFGIVPQTVVLEKDARYMAAGGIEAVRSPISWSGIEPKKGEYNWTAFDPIVEEAARQGMTVLPFVISTPGWVAKKETTLPIQNARQRTAYTTFLRAVVDRYKPGGQFWHEHLPAVIRAEKEKQAKGPDYDLPGAKLRPIAKPLPIKTWQIWNEANFFYFAYPVSPHDYAKLLKLSSPVIKRAEPGAKVILTGLFGRPTAGAKRGMPAVQFLRQLYRAPGIKAAFDGVALHPYAVDTETLEELVEELHEVTVENHDRVPLYITEMGWGSQNDFHINAFEHGVNGQVEELQSAYSYLIRNRGRLDLKQVYWFSWKDLPESCAFCDSVGLFHSGTGFRAKPAWRAFVQITRGKTHP